MITRVVVHAAFAVAWLLAAAPTPAHGATATEVNEAGATLFAAGRALEAAGKFDEALSLDPGSGEIRRNLAVALATLGQQDLQAGRLDEARARLERAAALAPGEAPSHLLLAVLSLRRGDLYEARQRIQRALEIEPGLAQARELSGDLHYQEGALDQARREWTAALETAGPGARALRAKLERLDREAQAEARFGRDVSRHFTLQFDGPVPPAVARTALRLLEEAYDRLARDFGRAPQHDLPVLLYSRELFSEVTRSPAWVAGAFDGKIRVPVGGLAGTADAERLAPVLAHELTHAFVRANAPGRLPLWFEEGLAMHFQGLGAEAALRLLRARGRGFAGLAAVDVALRGGTDVEAAYAAAALAIAEMVRLNGFWLPRRALERAGRGVAFADAFREAAGMGLEEFEERWVRRQH
ncbi:MAG TPA: tetratricopeptide repeat protein [Candidatus Methanoperedens sp.]|nr:tetratricopeptide repeat protein [Candidatus Methanoperedens sp.]